MTLSISGVSNDPLRPRTTYPSFGDASAISASNPAAELAKAIAPLLLSAAAMVDKLLTAALRQAMQAQEGAGGGFGSPTGGQGGSGGLPQAGAGSQGAHAAPHGNPGHVAHHGHQGHAVHHHGHQGHGHDAAVPTAGAPAKPTPPSGGHDAAVHTGGAAAAPTPSTDVTASSGVRPTAGVLPPMTGERIVNEPIVVKAGEVFDGQGVHFKAGPALGNGDQSETQKPVFILEPGAQLKNVQVSGADGIHAMGDAKLNNVWWRDVGEDAFTMKGPGNVQIEGGGAFNASDKIFQLNHGGSFSLDNFTADTFGKAVRTNGGKDFPIDISVTNSSFTNGKEAVVRTDATQASIHLENNTIENTKWDVEAPDAAKVEGATMRGWKDYTG